MDIVTHGLLGAALGAACASRQLARSAAIVCATGALLPDLDVFISRAGDPLFNLEMHRHFSHSLAFSPVGAAIAVIITFWFVRKRLSLTQTYTFALIGYISAIALDACTSYGTHLFWPFSQSRIALSIISVVDPIFTLSLILGLILAISRRKRWMSQLAVCFCACYLVVGFVQQQRAISTLEKEFAGSITPQTTLVAKPSFANILLWRGMLIDRSKISANAIRLGLFSASLIYPGESANRVYADTLSDWIDGSNLRAQDLERFAALSNNTMVQHPDDPTMVGDARFALLPTSVKPLWGVIPAGPEAHVQYITRRSLSDLDKQQFIKMLRGQPLDR